MTLFSATFLPGLLLIVIGTLLVISNSVITSTIKAIPRSPIAAGLFFGGGALWFIYIVWNVSEADLVLFQSPTPFVFIFGILAIAAFYYIPDFLAVRGLCVMTLCGGWQLLRAVFGEYDHPQRLFMVTLVYLCIALSLYLAAAPYRVRDFLQWLFARLPRARALGGAMLAYGVLLAVLAFTY